MVSHVPDEELSVLHLRVLSVYRSRFARAGLAPSELQVNNAENEARLCVGRNENVQTILDG